MKQSCHRTARTVVPVLAAVVGLIASVTAIAVASQGGKKASAPLSGAPFPPPAESTNAPAPAPAATDLGTGFSLPWPSRGQATVWVEGIGSLGVKGGQKPVPIASVTKVMTALVVLKDHPLKDDEEGPTIRIDAAAAAEASDPEQSTVRVAQGQSFSEREMLEMMLIPSGNNIARQLARWDAGSEHAFVGKMNAAAHSLGMSATTYTGASGYEASTKSTAVDQLKLAQGIITDGVFDQIVGMPAASVPGLRDRLVNTNTLLGQQGVIGMKTGSSTPAGGALMWAARQPDASGKTRLVLGVVLDQHQGPTSNDDLRAALAASRTLIGGVAHSLATAKAR